MTKVVWILSKEDKKEIEDLYEKKLALENLSRILDADNEKMYNKIIDDYGKTLRAFHDWWDVTSQKYQWEGSNWRVDFNTSEVVMNDA